MVGWLVPGSRQKVGLHWQKVNCGPVVATSPRSFPGKQQGGWGFTGWGQGMSLVGGQLLEKL